MFKKTKNIKNVLITYAFGCLRVRKRVYFLPMYAEYITYYGDSQVANVAKSRDGFSKEGFYVGCASVKWA